MDRVRHFKKEYIDEYQGPKEYDPVRRMLSKVLLQAVQEVCDERARMKTRIDAIKWLFFDVDEHASNMRNYILEVTGMTPTYLTLKVQGKLGQEKWNHLLRMVTYDMMKDGGE